MGFSDWSASFSQYCLLIALISWQTVSLFNNSLSMLMLTDCQFKVFQNDESFSGLEEYSGLLASFCDCSSIILNVSLEVNLISCFKRDSKRHIFLRLIDFWSISFWIILHIELSESFCLNWSCFSSLACKSNNNGF